MVTADNMAVRFGVAGTIALAAALVITQVVSGAEINPGKGNVKITTTPEGATVIVDGVALPDATPVTFEADPGAHSVTIRLLGYQDHTFDIEVVEGRTLVYNFQLVSTLARLEIRSTPAGASVTVDGALLDILTPVAVNLTPGSHTISLKLEGYDDHTDNVTLAAGESKVLSVPLVVTNLKVVLDIHSVPVGASIWINGADSGYLTPALLQGQPGTFMITLKLTGYQDFNQGITLTGGQVFTMDAIMSVAAETTWTCPIDNQTFNSEADYYNHLLTAHNIITIVWS